MTKYTFDDITVGKEGLLKGPFGSDLKRSLYVPKSKDTYKVYVQENILRENNDAGTHYISKEYYEKKMSRYAVKEGDFIVTCDGTLGEIFQLKNIKEKGIISSSLLRITLNNNIVDDNYFYYLWKAIIRKQLITQGNNSVLKHLPGIEVIRKHEIELPDLKTQQKVGQILKLIDTKISNNNAISSQLESLAKTIYDYWFLQFDFPDENSNPYRSSGGKMVWNDELKREIPEGWEVKNLQGLFNEKRGISYTSKNIKSNVGMPMINLACINTNREYRDGELKYYEGNLKNKTVLHGGELLIACTDLTRNADIIGCPIFVPEDGKEYLYTMDLVQILPSQKYFDELYFGKMLQTDYYHNYIKKWASGTNVLHLNLDGMRWYKTWIPPLPLQKRFSSIIKNINKKESLIMLENQQLISLRDFLLPLLMNGQVTIQ